MLQRAKRAHPLAKTPAYFYLISGSPELRGFGKTELLKLCYHRARACSENRFKAAIIERSLAPPSHAVTFKATVKSPKNEYAAGG
jgi:hypothetical protein